MVSFDVMQREVEGGVRRVAKKWRSADADDLRQEAWEAALEARRTFDASRGTAFSAYVGRAIRWRLENYMLRVSQAVSFPNNSRARHEMGARPTRCVPAEDSPLVSPAPTPERALDEKRWQVRLVARMIRTAGGAVELRVAVNGPSPDERRLAKVVRARLAADEELRRMWLRQYEET